VAVLMFVLVWFAGVVVLAWMYGGVGVIVLV